MSAPRDTPRKIRYGSVCSGVEAASMAWHDLGWTPQWFSEIEKFPSAVLAHHYPNVPNLGDMTKIKHTEIFNDPKRKIDLLVGGTPCQSFSVAGLRKGLADPRGNLALEYLALADLARPEWLVWENVPGVLSSNGGRDFGAFLGALSELGYGWAYRIVDAQNVGGCELHGDGGVPQRRRRVFVVANLTDWRLAAAVLFESTCLRGDLKKSRQAREGAPQGVEIGPGGGDLIDLAGTLDARCKDGPRRNQLASAVLTPAPAPHAPVFYERHDQDGRVKEIEVAPTLSSQSDNGCDLPILMTMREGCDGGGKGPLLSEDKSLSLATGNNQILFDPNQVTSKTNRSNPQPGDPCHTLPATANSPICFEQRSQDGVPRIHGDIAPTLNRMGGGQREPCVAVDVYNCAISEDIFAAVTSATGIANASGPKVLGENTLAPVVGAFKAGQSAAARSIGYEEELSPSLEAGGGGNNKPTIHVGMSVRRLTPIECERLQGFPIGYTDVFFRGKPASDGPRYKAIGNSMAVPVMAWLGKRIQMVEDFKNNNEDSPLDILGDLI